MGGRDVLGLTLVFCALAFASGCGGRQGGDGADLGTASSALISGNGLSGDALGGSGLTGYMLAPNPLTPSTIGSDAMSAIQDPSANGDLSRKLLEYTVGCAFDATQSFDFSWVDASGVTHDESYPGQIGLATDWSSQAIGSAEELWVSACLVSRVNYYGVHVEISSRGANDALAVGSDEASTYTMQEGAFFGNVFASTPTAFACDYLTDDDYSQSLDRDCAAGHIDDLGNLESCPNVQRVGSCDALGCTLDDTGTFYTSCQGPDGSTTDQVVTVYLHD